MQNQSNGVFVISLDAVDLNLLPTIYNERPDKVSPLWTRRNLQTKNDDYYQFEIKCKDCEGSNEDKPTKYEYKHKICHICDIEVPIPFWIVHIKSVIHKTNVRIADIAMQRMKKYLNEADHELDDNLHPSDHFCPTCITVIDSKDKNIHEKSPSHRNACIVERLFKDFLVLYDFNESNTNNVTNEQVISNTNVVQNDIAHNIKKENIPKEIETKKIHKDTTLNCKDNPKDIDIIANKDIFNLNSYVDLLNKHCNDIPMFFKVIDENFIEIETIDGSIVKVTDKHFNSFHKFSKKHWQCLVCKFNFKEKKVDAHALSLRHIANVVLPLKDKHCVRYISDDYYHCVICNTITENSDLHLLCNENHEKLLNKALLSDKLDENYAQANHNITEQSQYREDGPIFEKLDVDQKSINKNMISYADMLQTTKKSMSNNNTMNSNLNEVYDQTTENSYKKETVLLNESNTPNILSKPLPVPLGFIDKVEKFSNKSFCEFCNVYISKKHLSRHKLRPKHILNSISDPLYLMSEFDSIYLLCKVCHTRIINNTEDLRKHILDEDHKLKYKNLLLCNSMSKIDQYILYCELCEESVVIGNEIIHIDTKKHRFKYDTTEIIGFTHNEQENVEHDDENHEDDEGNHEDDDENNEEDDENHEDDDENHEDEQKNEAEISRTLLEFYKCTVCDVKVPNYSNNIQEHLKGRVHLKNMEKYSVDSNNKTQDSVANYHYHMELSEFPNCLNCIICNVNIMYNEDSVTQHLNDLTHARNYEILLENNFLVNKADNIYCNLCAVDAGVKGEILHIKGRKHKKNIEKYNQTTKTTAPENKPDNISTLTDIYYPSEDLIRAAHVRNIAPEMIFFLKEIDDKNVECVVCNVNIPFSEYNVRTHINGIKHAKNQKSGSMNELNK